MQFPMEINFFNNVITVVTTNAHNVNITKINRCILMLVNEVNTTTKSKKRYSAQKKQHQFHLKELIAYKKKQTQNLHDNNKK